MVMIMSQLNMILIKIRLPNPITTIEGFPDIRLSYNRFLTSDKNEKTKEESDEEAFNHLVYSYPNFNEKEIIGE